MERHPAKKKLNAQVSHRNQIYCTNRDPVSCTNAKRLYHLHRRSSTFLRVSQPLAHHTCHSYPSLSHSVETRLNLVHYKTTHIPTHLSSRIWSDAVRAYSTLHGSTIISNCNCRRGTRAWSGAEFPILGFVRGCTARVCILQTPAIACLIRKNGSRQLVCYNRSFSLFFSLLLISLLYDHGVHQRP
jgi:hypothetical protein